MNKNAVFAASNRVNPIYFGYPTREVDEVHITLPSGLEVESLPANDLVRLDYAIYQTTQKQDANTIISRRDIVMGGMAFPVTLYKELKSFYDKVKTGDDQQALLRGSAHAQAN